MAKQIVGSLKLVIPAGKANPSPPVGPALGQRGLNIMDFCKQFNDSTKSEKPGTPIPVVITVYADRSFTFIKKLAPVSYYIKELAKIKKGSGEAGKSKPVAEMTIDQIKVIAEKKIVDMNAYDIDSAIAMVRGTAVSMGIKVEG